MLLFTACSHSQQSPTRSTAETEPNFLDTLQLRHSLIDNQEHRFQMAVTPVVNGILGKTHSYGTEQYYYPASLVKIPAALVMLEILNELDFSLDATLRFNTDTVEVCGSTRFVEISQQKDLTFRQILKELIVASDNHFYNALYHVITPEYMRKKLGNAGFTNVHIYKAFTGCDTLQQLTTYPSVIAEGNGASKHVRNQAVVKMSPFAFRNAYVYEKDRCFGSQHENEEGNIVPGPYDLNYSIEIPLHDLHEMMLRFMFPEQFPEEKRWNIRPEDRTYVLELLGTYPSEIRSVYRSLKHLNDSIYKYATPQALTNVFRTYGKLGLSYGFASEVVFIPVEDRTNGFLLSYSVYVNQNDVVNDGKYEYEEEARPFAKTLTKHISRMYKSLE